MASIKDPEVAEVAKIDEVNPMGTDGFEFVEYTAPDPAALGALFRTSASSPSRSTAPRTSRSTARATSISSSTPRRTASPSALRAIMAPASAPSRFRVKDAAAPIERALSLGAGASRTRSGRWNSTFRPSRASADRASSCRPLRRERLDLRCRLRVLPDVERNPKGVGLTYIDHLTHNVQRGRMEDVGGLLRAALQLPRNPLLRHRGQADWPEDARR